jgi:hypothetical protein
LPGDLARIMTEQRGVFVTVASPICAVEKPTSFVDNFVRNPEGSGIQALK